jgi:hypothetical protein
VALDPCEGPRETSNPDAILDNKEKAATTRLSTGSGGTCLDIKDVLQKYRPAPTKYQHFILYGPSLPD